MRTVVACALVVGWAGCTIETGPLGGTAAAIDAGPVGTDAGEPTGDAGPFDAGRDAGPPPLDAGPRDAGPPCEPTAEVCNAVDDDCDGDVDEDGCPCERHILGTHVHLFCTGEAQRWAEARTWCQGFGYDLVVIGDEIENGYVRTYLTGDTWIGLSDVVTEGAYRWVDGTTLAWSNWRSPDAPRGTPAGYDCVEMDATTGEWLDVACTGDRPFVCEASPVP